MTLERSTPRIAIVGSGISGLATAWLLGDRFHVTLIERRSALGLGAEGLEVEAQGGRVRIDIPPRVFNAGHYRAMTSLLNDVAMPSYEIRQRPNFTDVRGRTYLGFETTGQGAQTRHRVQWHPRTWRWLGRHGAELYRWHRFVRDFEPGTVDAREALAPALARLGFSDRFRDGFLYPMWSLMCTCRYAQLDAFPARPVLELARNFGGSDATLRLKGGTRALEKRLQTRVHTTRLGRTVTCLEPQADRVVLRTEEDPEPMSFNHVVLATDPRSTRRILGDGPLAGDAALIARVPLHETRMIVHSADAHAKKRLRSPVNLHVDVERRRSSATLWMNPIEHEHLHDTLLQSWDPMALPAQDSVRAERTFTRALMNDASRRAMAELRAGMQGDAARRVWYVGAYLGDGVPLLENGVQSAHRVANLLRERHPAGARLAVARSA